MTLRVLAFVFLAGTASLTAADTNSPATITTNAAPPAGTSVMGETCQKTLKYKLASYSYPGAFYDEVIEGIFRPFLRNWVGAPCEKEVASNLTEWVAEREKVSAGQLKHQGKWYKDEEEIARHAMDVRAEQLLAAQDNSDLTDSETAALWKSGQLHVHSPGKQALAEPATYCFVGKMLRNGRPYLYIAYICMDPHMDQMLLNENNGTPQLSRDDGVEIFLDTERARTHYYQMIVNGRGDWWTGEIQNHGDGRYEIAAAWDPQAEIKTGSNKLAGRWMVEILIPFDRLGGVPAKGAVWGVNFCRNYRGQGRGDEENDNHLQSWFNVYDKSRNLHNPDLFGQFTW